MKVSLNWLSDYVDHGLSAEAVAEVLTMSGLEVEEVERTGPALAGVVVGHVLETRPHPDADRLTLCQVDLGPDLTPDGPVQIVCGAPNVAAGQKVPVATVGTTLDLPSREDPAVRTPVTLKRAKMRGETSEGMICAEDELGLGDSHDGILVLEEDAEPGEPLAAYLAARGGADAVLDLNVTPNRPDATSHVGVARDVAALAGRPLKLPDVDVPEAGGEAGRTVAVEIEDEAGCPRYVALLVRGVKVGPSPDWLRERLEAVGSRSINNVVDVTNYVMRELGQPLHAFDINKLEGDDTPVPAGLDGHGNVRLETTEYRKRLVVRRSVAGERLTTLDGVDRTLPEGTLVICDAAKPVALGGVMGGANSEVDDATTDVLIESAYFDPSSVRRAAKALGLATDAAYRFERGVDPTGQARAAARAAALIVEVAGGTLVDGMAEAHPRPYAARTVTLRPSRLNRLLGTPVPVDDAIRLLRAVGFEVVDGETHALEAFAAAVMRSEGLAAAEAAAVDAGLRVTIPPFRPDVTREVDVIEEVARLWGYDRIPDPPAAPVPLQPATEAPATVRLAAVRGRLVGLGFREVYGNSLVPSETAARFAVPSVVGYDVTPVETLNPISQEMAALRPSLLHGLLEAVAYNQARGASALRLFETARVYARGAQLGPNEDVTEPVAGYHEHTSLALAFTGPASPGGWDAAARAADVFDLKGALLHALGALDLPDVEETAVGEAGDHFDVALVLDAGGRRLGVLGRVAPALAARYDLKAPVYVAEVDADLLAALDRRATAVRYQPISRFPAVERDLAVVVEEGTPVGPLLATIREAGRPLLQDVRVFDLYRGERLGAGLKSVAFGLTFGADRTLRDEEVEGRMKRVVKALERDHGAKL
ncbi:MAG TPA: phenylalanine--tRNA ligase subunit beta, partial [Rhodothermales bacterium]|nr:phenylalanine--tRNA ligase subunit beta [Rhodothermales bacterium]